MGYALCMHKGGRKMKIFPIIEQSYKSTEHIPYDVIAPHEQQALNNHGQTLETLAKRGGLGWSEAYAVLTDSEFPRGKDYISEEYYKEKVKEIVSNYENQKNKRTLLTEVKNMLTKERQEMLDKELADICRNHISARCTKVDEKGNTIDCPFNKTSECGKAFFYEKGGQDAIINYSVAVLAEITERAKKEDAPAYEGDKEVDQWVRLSDVERAINKFLN